MPPAPPHTPLYPLREAAPPAAGDLRGGGEKKEQGRLRREEAGLTEQDKADDLEQVAEYGGEHGQDVEHWEQGEDKHEEQGDEDEGR